MQKYRLEKYTFWAIGITAITTALLILSMVYLRDARTHFIADRRPYVWPAEFEAVPAAINEPVKVHVLLVNFGKTPVIRERSSSQVLLFVGKPILDQADSFFANFDESKLPNENGITLPPGIPQTSRKPLTT